ncbi:DNA helicase-2/ATP-dependent DNA helicase PcrA [Massilia sp. UYP32]|uniref:UvrD-helicase domain-containing protein n=1 Tax=Massilia sp. UYP32 TaxID=1756386 RepID=UPI003D1B81EE
MKQFEPTHEQRLAIQHQGNAVITACAGSGKTSIISLKIAKIIQKLPDHRGVIAISYTNKSSDELRRRCVRLAVQVKRSYFGTIDKFCISEILIPFFPHLAVGAPTKISIRSIKSLDAAQQAEFSEQARHLTTSEINTILPLALRYLGRGIIILETVGIMAVHVLRHSAACQAYLKARFTHVFVDEYQDSGEPQHVMFLGLKELGLVAVAVGDANQSIFGYDKRDPRFLRSLCDRDSGFTEFKITQNHRCHPSIANYANRVLAPSCDLIPTDEVKVFRCKIDGAQAEIAKWIDSHIEELKKAYGILHNSEIAILTRGGGTAELIRRELKVPSRLFSDSNLSNSNYRHSSIFAGLLALRSDGGAPIQSFVESLLLDKMSRTEVSIVRRAIKQCRQVEQSRLKEQLLWTAELILAEATPHGSLEELESVLCDPNQLSLFDPVRDEQIQLMTLHKSKGLEFSFVYHLDLYDWIIPQRVFEKGNYDVVFVDEEQCLNLHYVGITRAKKGCALVHSTRRINFSGDSKAGNPSQFFDRPGLSGLYK